MSSDEKFMLLLKQEIEDAWRDFKEATKGIEKATSLRDCVNLRQLCEHRLSTFNVTFSHNTQICKELQFAPAQVGDGVVNCDDLWRARWVQGTEWILQLQYLIDQLCKQRDCPEHRHLFEVETALESAPPMATHSSAS